MIAGRILNDAHLEKIRQRLLLQLSKKIEKLCEDNQANKKRDPAQAQFFDGVEAATKHSWFVLDEILKDFDFEAGR